MFAVHRIQSEMHCCIFRQLDVYSIPQRDFVASCTNIKYWSALKLPMWMWERLLTLLSSFEGSDMPSWSTAAISVAFLTQLVTYTELCEITAKMSWWTWKTESHRLFANTFYAPARWTTCQWHDLKVMKAYDIWYLDKWSYALQFSCTSKYTQRHF